MKLSGLLPIRMALKLGPLTVFAATLFEQDEPEEPVISNTGVRLGFAIEPVDEVDTDLESLEDQCRP